MNMSTCLFCSVSRRLFMFNNGSSGRSMATQAAAMTRIVSESFQQRIQQKQLALGQHEASCSPIIENRNPRNLEQLGLARKQLGWQLHHPRKDYWHKLNFVRTNRNTSANVTHCSGAVVISASTNEPAIRRHLESTTDVSAASLIGAVLSERCLGAGITCLHFNKGEYEDAKNSKRLTAFVDELKENGVSLEEPKSRAHEIEDELMGVDYDLKEDEALRKEKEIARKRAEIAQISAKIRERALNATAPVNFKIMPDGRGVSAETGETICPKAPSPEELAQAAEEERRRRSVYVIKPPSSNQKPSPTKPVFAE